MFIEKYGEELMHFSGGEMSKYIQDPDVPENFKILLTENCGHYSNGERYSTLRFKEFDEFILQNALLENKYDIDIGGGGIQKHIQEQFDDYNTNASSSIIKFAETASTLYVVCVGGNKSHYVGFHSHRSVFWLNFLEKN